MKAMGGEVDNLLCKRRVYINFYFFHVVACNMLNTLINDFDWFVRTLMTHFSSRIAIRSQHS
jgi:hypothetical protein